MAKSKICKVTKDDMQNKKPEKFVKLIAGAQYYCKKCGHVAAKKDNLCKPEKIKKSGK